MDLLTSSTQPEYRDPVPATPPADDAFSVTLTNEGDLFVHVGFFGDLDVVARPRAEAALRLAERQTEGTVVADLSGLRFADSTVVHVISAAVQRMRGRLIVLRGPAQVQRLFDLTDGGATSVPFAD
jgi:anti-anti-sigma factor